MLNVNSTRDNNNLNLLPPPETVPNRQPLKFPTRRAPNLRFLRSHPFSTQTQEQKIRYSGTNPEPKNRFSCATEEQKTYYSETGEPKTGFVPPYSRTTTEEPKNRFAPRYSRTVEESKTRFVSPRFSRTTEEPKRFGIRTRHCTEDSDGVSIASEGSFEFDPEFNLSEITEQVLQQVFVSSSIETKG